MIRLLAAINWDAVNWEAVGSITAAFVAVLALGVAVNEGRATRKHNRLSVRPLLRIDYLEDGITLQNTGSGPAILNVFEVFLDGEAIEYEIGDLPAIVAAETLEIADLVPPSDTGDGAFYAYTPDPENSMMAQEKLDLLKVSKLPANIDDRLELWERLLRVTFRIHYASVYGEKQIYPVEL